MPSIIKLDGSAADVAQAEPNVWNEVETRWAGSSRQRWKMLLCLTLYETCGWTCEMIGTAFGHARGHISRLVNQCRDELREEFDRSDFYPDSQGAEDGECEYRRAA